MRAKKKKLYGIHEVTMLSRKTGKVLGSFEVLAGSSFEVSGEMTKLKGGSNKYSWDSAQGPIEASVKLKAREYPVFAQALFTGAAVIESAAEPSGYCSSLTNKFGTSVLDATTGIASVVVKTGKESDLKFGKYTIVRKTATTIDVIAKQSLDLDRGTGVIVDDDLHVVLKDLTVTSGGATELTGLGVEITGGSGTISMDEGDTAEFETRPINSGSTKTVVGSPSDELEEFEMILQAEKHNKEMCILHVYRAKSFGMNYAMEENAFGEYEQSIEVLYDRERRAVFEKEEVSVDV